MAFARLTGTVHKIEHKNGTYFDAQKVERPWSLTLVKILTEDGVTDAKLPRDLADIGGEPALGAQVDYNVEVDVRKGRLDISVLSNVGDEDHYASSPFLASASA